MTETARRYLLVGIACALLHNAVMIGCDLFGIHYLPASLASYVIVVLCGFALHSRFTFERRPSTTSLLRYAAGMAANYPASIALMFVFCDLAGQPVVIAAPLATVLLFLSNFLTSRWAIVGKSTRHESA
jgi:putative flippase GtrA